MKNIKDIIKEDYNTVCLDFIGDTDEVSYIKYTNRMDYVNHLRRLVNLGGFKDPVIVIYGLDKVKWYDLDSYKGTSLVVTIQEEYDVRKLLFLGYKEEK